MKHRVDGGPPRRRKRVWPGLFVAAALAACSSASTTRDLGSPVEPFDGGVRPADDAGTISPSGDAGVNKPDEKDPDGGVKITHDAGAGVPINLDVHLTLERENESGLPGCYRCSLASADFDGDGKPDLVMAGAFDRAWSPNMASYTFENVIRVYRNVSERGHVAFELAEEVPDVRGGGGAIVRIGDFDGDGRPDFAVQFREGISPYSDTAGYMNLGGFAFVRAVLAVGFDTNSTSLGMSVGDFDGDMRDDLVFNSDGQRFGPGLWYSFDPSLGRWQPMQPDFIHRISYGGTIAAGDLDGDGYAEIIVGGNSSFIFGNYDCAAERIYGEMHWNKGAAGGGGIDPDGAIPLEDFSLRHDPAHPLHCSGMDNADVLMADVDRDGHEDVIIAGSTDAFGGPPGLNVTHYDFVVLRNVDGTGKHFVTFENAGPQLPGGTTNAGSANVDLPSIAVGDLTGDGWPEVFIQGHHRDYEHDAGAYIFDSKLFVNVGGADFQEVDVGLPDVGEGGQVIADFDGDGLGDLIFSGATIPFHSNGNNPLDRNDRTTIFTWVYRNVRE